MPTRLFFDRARITGALGLVTTLCAAQPLVSAAPQEAPAELEVGQLFEQRCLACHMPPDPSFAVDRAWLLQVNDTA